MPALMENAGRPTMIPSTGTQQEEPMRKAILALLLFAPAISWAVKEKPAPNPADYSIAVHVQSSRLARSQLLGGITVQRLTASIDGKKYELEERRFSYDVLHVGDYNARIIKDQTQQAYEYQRTYEFLFPDGQIRQYSVVGEEQ
jgi:hypothetical protein